MGEAYTAGHRGGGSCRSPVALGCEPVGGEVGSLHTLEGDHSQARRPAAGAGPLGRSLLAREVPTELDALGQVRPRVDPELDPVRVGAGPVVAGGADAL